MKLALDENFNNDILRALLRRAPSLDVVRIQDCGLGGADDPTVLEWAARENRVVLTHDVSTMTRFAYERAVRGEPMPGLVEVPNSLAIRLAAEDILLLVGCSEPGEWEHRVLYLPLR